MGFISTGTDAAARYRSTIGASASGPREQLTPTALAPSPSSMATMASGVPPVISFPSDPYALETNTGRSQFSFAASSAARVSWLSFIVSMKMQSAPFPAPMRMICA